MYNYKEITRHSNLSLVILMLNWLLYILFTILY